MADLKRAALDLLFPRWCVGCGKEGSYICADCRRDLPFILAPVCVFCGRPLGHEAVCRGCDNVPAQIDGIRSPFIFDGVIRKAIHEFKYRNLRALAPLMAELLYDYLRQNQVAGEVLVPVPLHRRRLRERGYNQSALLAHELGKLTGLPVVDGVLVRQSYNPPQARSDITDRRKNVAGAFTCIDDRLKDKKVILVDDVSTSGATLNSCAAALKARGTSSVRGLVMALEL